MPENKHQNVKVSNSNNHDMKYLRDTFLLVSLKLKLKL